MNMKRQNKSCRCCGFETFKYLAPKMVSNFFLNNGLHISSKVKIRGAKFLERYLPKFFLDIFYSFFNNILNIQTEIEYGHCVNCNFIGPWPEISDDTLSDFYKIYGNQDYKTLRSIYEPWYKNIALLHLSEYEFEMRRIQHIKYVLPILNSLKESTLNILDYAGGGGIVTPQEKSIIVDVYSYENSSTFTIWNGNEKCYKQSTTQKYDFVQLLHVLEHVGNPRNVLKNAMSFIKKNGYLYVELPWEYENLNNVLSGNERINCSEHINFFAPEVMMETLKSLGLSEISCEEGWVKMTHQVKPVRVIRCLSRLC